MTRKDYVAIAVALRRARQTHPGDGILHETGANYLEGCTLAEAHRAGIAESTAQIANVLAADNPRFDREHFLAVVRGERDLNSRPPRR